MQQNILNFFTHVTDAAWIVQTVCVSLAIIVFLAEFESKKDILVKGVAGFFILCAVILGVNLLLHMISFYIRLFSGIGFWFAFLFADLVYCIAFCRYRTALRVIMGFACFALIIIMGSLGTVFGNLFYNSYPDFDTAVTKIISYILLVGFAALCRRFNLAQFKVSSYAVWLNVACNGLSSIAVLVFEYSSVRSLAMYRVQVSGFAASVFSSLFVINVITYFMTYNLFKERESLLEVQSENIKLSAAREMLVYSEHNLDELREIRHDLKNQYAYMQTMLEAGKYDELLTYFNESKSTFAEPLFVLIDCGNQQVNAILNLEKSKAEAAGVTFDAKVAIPEKLVFSENDMLCLFTNVIDNAVEACARMGEGKKYIDVILDVQGDYMRLLVSNPADEVDLRETSKEDKKSHGYGLKIINRIIKKYNGYLRTDCENGVFSVEVILDMNV